MLLHCMECEPKAIQIQVDSTMDDRETNVVGLGGRRLFPSRRVSNMYINGRVGLHALLTTYL